MKTIQERLQDLKLDHLLHAVHDPEQVRNAFAVELGWRTMAGGEHPAFGTYNALSYFGLSYIEWISVRAHALAITNELGLRVTQALKRREGPFQCALRTREMDPLVGDWQERSLPFHGPVAAFRTLPDGRILRWRMLFPGQGEPDDYLLPFVIEWEEEDSTRLQDLDRRGAISLQALPVQQPLAIHTCVRSIAALQARLELYYPVQGSFMADDSWGQGISYRVGETALWFWEPAADGELGAILRSVGERPFQLDVGEEGVDPSIFSCTLSSLDLYGLRVRRLAQQGGHENAK